MKPSEQEPILAHTTIARPRLCPEIALRLITPGTPLWRASEEQAAELGIVEPYWAFCWAGGQAVARHVLDHPELVRARRVLDFGCGGAVAGIAAGLRGATVLASDIDPLAVRAAEDNAALNDVTLQTTTEDLIGRLDVRWDVVLVGDVTYEPGLAARVIPWLVALAGGGTTVLLGDPGRGHLDPSRLEPLATYEAPPDNDPGESFFVRTTVYRVT